MLTAFHFPFARLMLDARTGEGFGETHDHEGSAIMKRARIIAGAISTSALLVALAGPAAADRWRQAPADPTYPHITTSSQYDPSDSVSGAVRSGPRGDEVRLPGGTWVPCGFNCYFTLRNATVDFWRRYDVFPQ
jgi:hypothetical protein